MRTESKTFRDRIEDTLREFTISANPGNIDIKLEQYTEKLLELIYDEMKYRYRVKGI